MNEWVTQFNSLLRKLVASLAARSPHDAVILRTKKRVFLVSNENPESVLREAGMYLFNYHLEHDYHEHFAAKDPAENEYMRQIICRVKATWRNSGPDEQADYIETVQDLLDIYIEYCADIMQMDSNTGSASTIATPRNTA